MKRTLCSLLAALLAVLSLSACGGAPAQNEDTSLTIAATTYPIYLFTTAITQGVDDIDVTLMIKQETSCLHDYTLTVNDMKLIEKADVIVMNGAGLEDFLSDALSASDAQTIVCAQDMELLPALGHEGHDHAVEYDPHLWMCEEAALVMLNNIREGLSAIDPAHQEAYTANFDAAVSALPNDPLADAQLACPYLITFHDGFQYFAQDNGLTLLKSIEEEEGSEASAADIKEIIHLIQTYNIPAIFTEVNGSDATAQAIARETGVQVYPLDLIMSGEGEGIQPYVDALEANYQTILQALGGK